MIDTTQVKSDDEKREIAKIIAQKHMAENASNDIESEYKTFMDAYYYVLGQLQR